MIGIRREDKSEWERRVPLVPEDLRDLMRDAGVKFQVQRSPIRAFKDQTYAAEGAEIVDELDACPIILGVKEIPPQKLKPDKAYVYFAHVIKGQPANMPALKKLLSQNDTLIDYEKITDEEGRRLVFFGRYAGLAGMIDTLWALGQRLRHEGIRNPFARVQPAHRYDDLEHVSRELARVAEEIRAGGIPDAVQPLICGFAGYGQVSQGAQQIFDQLPVKEVAVEDLERVPPVADTCYKVVFREEDIVKPRESGHAFDLQEYYDHPERYEAAFFPQASFLTLLVNCIYWEEKYPRLLTRDQFRELYDEGQPLLRVIGDITCDIDGSLACTTRATDPSSPVYVYDPRTGDTQAGVGGHGPVVLAVDFLPCELPVDASRHFSASLRPFIPALAAADLSKPLAESGLPPELQRATIVYHGQLTEPYRYLEAHVKGSKERK